MKSHVVTDKDARLMKALESLYGKADYDMKNETYFWKTDQLILKFKSEGKRTLANAVYFLWCAQNDATR